MPFIPNQRRGRPGEVNVRPADARGGIRPRLRPRDPFRETDGCGWTPLTEPGRARHSIAFFWRPKPPHFGHTASPLWFGPLRQKICVCWPNMVFSTGLSMVFRNSFSLEGKLIKPNRRELKPSGQGGSKGGCPLGTAFGGLDAVARAAVPFWQKSRFRRVGNLPGRQKAAGPIGPQGCTT